MKSLAYYFLESNSIDMNFKWYIERQMEVGYTINSVWNFYPLKTHHALKCGYKIQRLFFF